MKLVVLDGYAANPGDLSWEELSRQGELTVYDRTAPEERMERIAGAEALFTNKTVLDREILQKNPQVKYVGVLATGYNVVDVESAKVLGITVTNIPAYSTSAVAQLTIALLLELAHHVGEHNRSILAGKWQNAPDYAYWDYPQVELAGKVFGIIGYGSIGQAAGKIAEAMGMRVMGYSRSKLGAGGVYVTLEEIFRRSDVISLHCPLNGDSQEIINRRTLSQCKKGVWLLNTSRGGLIQERDLAQALNDGQVGAFAADVLSVEPPRAGNVLIGAPNTILTPHIAWAADAARKRLLHQAGENLRAWLAGSPVNVVS